MKKKPMKKAAKPTSKKPCSKPDGVTSNSEISPTPNPGGPSGPPNP